MITTLTRDQLVALGAGYRAAYLVQQAGYTLGIAAAEEGEIEAVVGDTNLLEEVTATKASVETVMADRDLLAQESKTLTTVQNQKLREAKVWRRKVALRAARARRQGKTTVPESLTVIGRLGGVPDVLAALTSTIATFESNLADLGGDRARALLEDGKRINSALGTADASQEQARLSGLPVKVQDFYAAKGLLYVGLKVINDAGQELHAGDPARAGQYNLKILYRSGARKRAAGGGEPTG